MAGSGRSGSWVIRGQQLAEAIGADVCTNGAVGAADMVIGVKRVADSLASAARGRLVWDVVDAYPQPRGNEWGESECKSWLVGEVRRIRPKAVIAATQRMAQDCKGLGIPVLYLPHHHRPGIARNPIRERIEVVGYEGGENYIGRWRAVIEEECARIGARFVINPSRLADVDVVLALRDSHGYAPRNWKSNVKLANAHGSGTPWIGCREAGYIETAAGTEYWADTPSELRVALNWLSDQSAREQVSDRFVAAAFPVEKAAEVLWNFLKGL